MKLKSSVPAVVVGVIVGVLAACGGSSVADSNDSAAISQLQQQVAALQQTVSGLQTTVTSLQAQTGPRPAVFIKAPNATAALRGVARTRATGSSTCVGLGTLTGRPTNSDPITSNIYSGVSCTGYYFNITAAASSADNGVILPVMDQNEQRSISFDGPDCTGNKFISASAPAIAQGFVARVDFTNADPNGNDPGTYWYVAAGTPFTQFTGMSMSYNGQCTNIPFPGINAGYKMLPNDPAVTGVQSAPVPGPITISG